MIEDNKKYNPSTEEFEFVQVDEKIYDKRFETKPIGYFKDAMIRFSKNRTNVIATTILVIIILCSIIIPIVSTKNVEDLDDNFSGLPPRMPYLEKLGIADGTVKKEDQTVDLDRIDPVTGLGYPIGIDEEYIVEGSLTNYIQGCTIAKDVCVGGENVMRVSSTTDHVTIVSGVNVWLDATENPFLYINVNEFEGDDAELRVFAKVGSTFRTVQVIDSAGEYTFDLTDITTAGMTAFGSQVKLAFYSDSVDDYVIFDTVELGDDLIKDDNTKGYYSGFELSEFEYDSTDEEQGGLFQRQNGELLLASFTYEVYAATFSDRLNEAFPNSQYQELITEYADVCIPSDDPDNDDAVGVIYPEACPIKKIISKTSEVIVDGEAHFSYAVIINYAQVEGYEEIPYFLFGTDAAGRDLFTLLWVATRTSLLLGFVVAFINIVIGVIYGSVSGYYGGMTDLILQRISEVIGRIPWLVILSIMIALLGPGIQTLIFILIIQGWIGIASITRTQFYRYKGREYVLASRTLGAKDGRLIFRHILPNGIGTIITTSVLTIPYVIFNESTISFLGFGIGHGQSFNVFGIEFSGVSVGVLLADGRRELQQRPYLTVFPAILISILMITFNMFGNALRDALNPALRGSE